jgi:hypothetical protein
VRNELDRSPYYGDLYVYTKHLVELAASRFAQREPAIKIMESFKQGKESKDAMDELKEMGKSDLLVRLDHIELAKALKKSGYQKMVKNIEKGIKNKNVDELSQIHEELMRESDFPNRSMLLKQVSEALHRLTLTQFALTFEQWQDLWTTISLQFPKLTGVLKETLEPPKRKIVRTDGLTVVVYVTGDKPDSAVFLEISGGTSALQLKEEIEKQIGE